MQPRDHYHRILSFEQSQRRRLNRPRLVQYLINRRYYYGDNTQPDDVNQPLGIRYVPKIVNKHAHYLFGEWENDIVDWIVTPKQKENEEAYDTASMISQALYRIMRRSDADERIYRTALDAGIYGDGVFKLRYDRSVGGAIFENVLPEYFHAMWHPLNVGSTRECLIAYNLDRETAFAQFGTIGNPQYQNHLSLLDPGFSTVWEHWTPTEYRLMVDDVEIAEGTNPYAPIPGVGEKQASGWLPFIHIPNLPVNGEYFGFGDAEPVYELQDELNMRIADFGDVINYHAHPITLVKNYFGRFEDLKTGPDVVWDMGREGEANYLEWGGSAPGVMDYLNLLLTTLMDTSSLTGVAFGRAEQSQASGSALVVQMLPIVEVVRRKRATWNPKLKDLAIRLLELESMSMSAARFKEIYGFFPREIGNYEIMPKWAPVLPKDRAAIVNEQIGLLTSKARSIITALKELGVDNPEAERDRIVADIKEFGAIQMEMITQQLSIETDLNKDLASHEAHVGVPTKKVSGGSSTAETPNRSGGKNSTPMIRGSNENE